MRRRALELGELRVTPLCDGRFKLDGGAMFGVVPRALWERMVAPDEHNRIPLALHPFLVEGPHGRLLLEPGIGSRWTPKEVGLFAIDHGEIPADGSEASACAGRCGEVVGNLAELGLAPEDIDIVVLSHAHWDHAGAAVRRDESGRLVPTFPRARLVVAAAEIAAARDGEHLRRGSYRAEDLEPLLEQIEVERVEATEPGEGHAIAAGIEMRVVGGHSEGVSILELRGGGRTAVFWSDVVPTSNHVHPHYIMAYDMNAELSYRRRRPLIEQAAREGWIALYYHDPRFVFGRFIEERGRLRHEPLPEAESLALR